jgi:2-keto-3-deoxy-L-rhamnonate aldolase RhmA/ketosteroid isomerase-like protein
LRAAQTAGDELRAAYRERIVRGTFLIELPTPRTVRALALSGYDFVVLDLEHSPFGIDTLPALVAECQACGVPAIVRVWGLDDAVVGKVLDLGVSGIMVPRIRDAADAERAVRCARYAPEGERGVAPLIGHRAIRELDPEAAAHVLVVLQVEGADALAAIEDIAAVSGVDAIFVGPYDLAQSLGEGHDVHADAVVDAALRVAAACGQRTMLGIYVDDPFQSRRWGDRGFRFQCVSFDGRMLVEGAARALSEAKGGDVTREQLEHVVRVYYDGCNEGDVDKMVACFSPDAAHYFPAGAPQGTFAGARAIAEGWRSAVRTHGSRWTIDRMSTDVQRREVIVEWTHWKTKHDAHLRGLEVCCIDAAGKLTEVRAYYAAPATGAGVTHELGGFDYAGRGYPLTAPSAPPPLGADR